MFEMGDKVITVTDDFLDSKEGVVVHTFSPDQSANIILDEFRSDGSLNFKFSVLRKVEQA